MIIQIGDVLDAQALQRIAAELRDAPFVDGRSTAGWAAQTVKKNLQLDAAARAHASVSEIVRQAMASNETLQSAALPRAVSALLFSRTEPGMEYGPHVDNAVMGTPALRTDLAFTLFLSPPSDYSGGELVISDMEGDNAIKLDAGALVLYPASSVHRVATVSSGQRNVCVGWIQSLVRDPRVREMIFDLSRVKLRLFQEGGASSEAFQLVAKTQSNLLRMHAEI